MRYPILHFTSLAYRVLGVACAILTLVAAITLLSRALSASEIINPVTGEQLGDVVKVVGSTVALYILIGGIFASLSMFAVGEFIKLMIDIEQNTRDTHHAIERRRAPEPTNQPRDLAPVAPNWKPHKPPLPVAKPSWNEGAFWQRAARRRRLTVDDVDF